MRQSAQEHPMLPRAPGQQYCVFERNSTSSISLSITQARRCPCRAPHVWCWTRRLPATTLSQRAPCVLWALIRILVLPRSRSGPPVDIGPWRRSCEPTNHQEGKRECGPTIYRRAGNFLTNKPFSGKGAHSARGVPCACNSLLERALRIAVDLAGTGAVWHNAGVRALESLRLSPFSCTGASDG